MANGDRPLVEKVLEYIRDRNLKIVEAIEISKSAVAIRDESNEIDVYFSAAHFNVKYPKIWGKFQEDLFGLLETYGLGVLCGNTTIHSPENFDDALRFAKYHLEPRGKKNDWYDEPLPQEINLSDLI